MANNFNSSYKFFILRLYIIIVKKKSIYFSFRILTFCFTLIKKYSSYGDKHSLKMAVTIKPFLIYIMVNWNFFGRGHNVFFSNGLTYIFLGENLNAVIHVPTYQNKCFTSDFFGGKSLSMA